MKNRAGRCVVLFAVVFLAALAACKGGGIESTAKSGTVQIALADAPGNFFSYAVDVQSLKLRQANGDLVETLPATTRVDFAEFVDLTELVTVKSIPNGSYVAASITLDYGNSRIVVADAGGNPVQATPVDAAGNPLTTLTLEVRFDDRHHLVIAPGLAGHISLDFDLDASNTVDNGFSPPHVMVLPVLTADVDFKNDRRHRIHGEIGRVDTADNRFVVDVHPFDRRSGDFGKVPVSVNSSTSYEVNGALFTGSAGLAQLAALSLPAPVVASGHVDRHDRHFVAQHVFAGSSVPFVNNDGLRGHVLARNGNTLTVLGALFDHSNGAVSFSPAISVNVAGAQVTAADDHDGGNHEEEHENTAKSTDDISVGSRIEALGLCNGACSSLNFNASRVRLKFTAASGLVTSTSPLTLNAQQIGGIPVARFNFAGTGANPSGYRIDATGLSLNGINVNDPVRVFGFVAPFGASSSFDFAARSIEDAANARAFMTVSWVQPGSSAAFSGISANSLIINIADPLLGPAHHVLRSGIALDLTTRGSNPGIVPGHNDDDDDNDHSNDNDGVFVVAIPQLHQVNVYESFADFAGALGSGISGGAKVRVINGRGLYTDATNSLHARAASVVLQQ